MERHRGGAGHRAALRAVERTAHRRTLFRQSALCDLLGVPVDKVDDNRLYRGLDQLLPHKQALEAFLKERFGELFAIEYDLLLYDVTSTYFEGQANANPLASAAIRATIGPDCKQVCIGLVVTRCGLPLGYEVFAGNRHDSTTLEEIVETMEARYGRAQRIWALDRGMVSEDNLDFLKAGQRQYIVGTPKSQLKRFEQQLGFRRRREGCYLLRSNVPDWTAEELWKAYMQLTDAEAAFRIQKDNLQLRPVWHQTTERVQAHILVCFLAYVLHKTLEGWGRKAGLGSSPNTLLEEFARIQSTDVLLPATDGRTVRLRCVVRPDRAQAILLDHLGLTLPDRLRPLPGISKM